MICDAPVLYTGVMENLTSYFGCDLPAGERVITTSPIYTAAICQPGTLHQFKINHVIATWQNGHYEKNVLKFEIFTMWVIVQLTRRHKYMFMILKNSDEKDPGYDTTLTDISYYFKLRSTLWPWNYVHLLTMCTWLFSK